MKYKVGDKVRIKSIDWYNENKDEFGNIGHFSLEMAQFCGQITIISEETPIYYRMENIDNFLWTDEMIEGLVEDGTIVDYVKESNDRYRIVIDPRFDIEVDEGEYYAVRREKKYPKTYEECEKILGLEGSIIEGCLGYEYKLLNAFQKLLMCRDAYWKIAGEEMGLGKPWEPSGNEDCFVISRSCGEVYLYSSAGDCDPFEFPTEEMRDAFKENFDPDIEICKEFL